MDLQKVIERLNRSLGQKINEADRVVAKQYAQALAEARSELAKMFERYEQGGKLTYAEMARYDRLSKFMERLEDLLNQNHKIIAKTIMETLGDIYRDGYYMTSWAVETETLSKLAYSAVGADAISKALENPVSGLTLSERLEKKRRDILYDIRQTVTQGLVQGETYGTMAKRLKDTLEGDAAKAMRIVRTEGHRVLESSKHESVAHANKQGVLMLKEWNSVEDERVRSSHADLNGKKIPIDQNFRSARGSGPAPGQLGHPAEDINCRCFLTYTVEDVGKPDAKELENMAFEEWRKERIRS